MSAIQKIYHSVTDMRQRYLQHITYKAEMRNINRKEILWSKVLLSDAQEKEIKSYWKEISGYEIETKWHRLYQSYMGVYEKKYFPEILYTTQLERKLNPPKYYGVLSDKGFMKTIFSGGGYRLPKTFVYNCDGVLTDDEQNVISYREAVAMLHNAGKIIAKPTIDTSSGDGVRLLDLQEGIDSVTGEDTATILTGLRRNYVIQECVKQHKSLADIYAGSLNTFRVITYICENKVYLAPVSMRIGSGGAYVDNIHAGGLCIGVQENCSLRKFAFTEMGNKFETHPDSHVSFEDYSIPLLSKIKEIAKRLHGSIPQLKMISWDWSLDSDGIPILIEINISGQAVWFPQMLNGEAIFGDNTEYFAEIIRKKRGIHSCF